MKETNLQDRGGRKLKAVGGYMNMKISDIHPVNKPLLRKYRGVMGMWDCK
jgi:hypothetical protein